MSRGFSKVLKTVAMIAVPFVAAVAAPFVAPIIGGALGAVGFGGLGAALGLGGAGAAATALGSGITGSLLGAGLGAATGALTGRGALTGAITGGLGGALGGAAQIGSAIGLAPAVSSAGALGGLPVGVVGGAGGLAVPTFGAAAPAAAGIAGTLGTSAGVLGTGAAAASPILSNTINSLLGKFVQGINPGGLADLAMTMYNKPEAGLNEEEKRALYETAQLAQTNQDLFKERVEKAAMLWQTAQANPEQAYAETVSGVQRGLSEDIRRGGGGMSTGARRQAMRREANIRSAQAGSTAVAAENARAAQGMSTAAGMAPTSAPVGAAMASLPIYQAARRREDQYEEQLARATGGLFGGIYNSGSQNRGLITPQYG